MARPRPVKIELTAMSCWVSWVIRNPDVAGGPLLAADVAENMVASRLQLNAISVTNVDQGDVDVPGKSYELHSNE